MSRPQQLLTVHLQTKPRSHAERGPLLHLYRAGPRGRDTAGPDGAKGRRLGQKTHWYRWSGRQSIACRSQRRNAGDGQGVLWLSMWRWESNDVTYEIKTAQSRLRTVHCQHGKMPRPTKGEPGATGGRRVGLALRLALHMRVPVLLFEAQRFPTFTACRRIVQQRVDRSPFHSRACVLPLESLYNKMTKT